MTTNQDNYRANRSFQLASERHLALVASWQPMNCPADLSVGRGRTGGAYGVHYSQSVREVFSGTLAECHAFIAGIVFDRS